MTSLITTTVQQIRVNRYHPLIKETYRGIAAPHYTSGTVTWPVVGNTTQPKGSQRARQTETESGPSQGESSTSHPVPDMTATIFKKPALPVQRDTYHSAKNDGQTSDPTTSASVPSIEELSAMPLMKELDNAREALVARDARIAELEGTAGTTGRKRVRFEH
ncbi:predicted protein [Pyrenophora tritici-repentis Pt-1C-BFP]|uniref:Uncharacterized protein n=1 Tax=Pyrenophora tritici-repentis (strain Pt-1C-BFP) TaxID=426418 RepID=B2WEP6_PYRTR|nr:uncharacterized protein PTRG_08619 [Pyrenophora tritici-repentis Pt-1C-BFP]EDU51538.1 predicted protein [Pyrenophora tritici-repentis Pt-1C-BFP]